MAQTAARFAGVPPTGRVCRQTRCAQKFVVPSTAVQQRHRIVAAAHARALDIEVINAPTAQQLKERGVESWPIWSCGVSKFPWSYDQNESCLLLEGEVYVTPDGGEPVVIKAGDFVTFPRGMSCTWDVKKAVRKHYNFF